MPNYFATCARGLELLLAEEVRALGAIDIESGRGGVSFAGDHALLYKANLWLRTAVRVLRPVLTAPVQTPDDLYDVASLSLDSSWDSLHKRGYRPALTRAPRNEALAAGLLPESVWVPGSYEPDMALTQKRKMRDSETLTQRSHPLL